MPANGAAGKAGTVEMPSYQPQEHSGSTILKPSGGGKASTKSTITAEEQATRVKQMQMLFDLQKNLDCVFVIDTTGSMDEYIAAVKEAIKELV